MRKITVYTSDGNATATSIDGTDDEIIRRHLGIRFEVEGVTEPHVALCIHFHDTDKRYGLRIKCIEHAGVSGSIVDVRRENVKVDDSNSFDEIMLTVGSGSEYSLDDVWVYDLDGEWVRGIGYKHPVA